MENRSCCCAPRVESHIAQNSNLQRESADSSDLLFSLPAHPCLSLRACLQEGNAQPYVPPALTAAIAELRSAASRTSNLVAEGALSSIELAIEDGGVGPNGEARQSQHHEQGLCPVIAGEAVRAMRRHPRCAAVQLTAIRVLSLVCGTAVLTTGGVEAMLEAMRSHERNEHVVCAGCVTLDILAGESDDCAERAAGAGALEVLISTLEGPHALRAVIADAGVVGPGVCCEAAARALGRIVASLSEDEDAEEAALRGARAVMRLVRQATTIRAPIMSHEPGVSLCQLAEALWLLSRQGEDGRVLEVMMASGGPELIVRGIRGLLAVAPPPPEDDDRDAEEEGGGHRHHGADCFICNWCTFVAVLSGNERNLSRLLRAGVGLAVIDAMRQHARSPRLAPLACVALRALLARSGTAFAGAHSRSRERDEAAATVGLAESLAAVEAAHPDNEDVMIHVPHIRELMLLPAAAPAGGAAGAGAGAAARP